MKTLLILVLLLAGCTHIPPGGAETWKTSIGVPGVVFWETDNKGISITAKRITAASHTGSLQILAFTWRNEGTKVVLYNPPEERTEYVTKTHP